MLSQNKPLIGILGGMGPQAGLDLASKVISETRAENDQDHIPLVLFSSPGSISDRSEFLLGRTTVNPAEALALQVGKMVELNVTVAAMACNTVHAAPIFDSLMKIIDKNGGKLRILHLIEETIDHIQNEFPHVSRTGILGTRGTYQFELYDGPLREAGVEPILPTPEIREEKIHKAIYDPVSGIKSCSNPVSIEARNRVVEAVQHLRSRGAELIILGCTELPLALTESLIDDIPLVDPTRILARALIRASYPDRLLP